MILLGLHINICNETIYVNKFYVKRNLLKFKKPEIFIYANIF